MYVKCVKNRAGSLDGEVVNKLQLHSEKNFDVEVGQSYVVYSMCLVRGVVKYLIHNEIGSIVSGWYPAFLFDVIDSRVSRYWKVWHRSEYSEAYVQTIWGFAELVEDKGYFTRLIDKEQDSLMVFSRYRKQMDVEFDVGQSENTASFLEKNWLMCGKCDNAFEDNSPLDEVVSCPSCQCLLKMTRN